MIPKAERERRLRIVEALIIQGRAMDIGGLINGLAEAGITVSTPTAVRYALEARKRLSSADDELRTARREILTRKVLALDASIAAGISKHDVIPTWADRIACLRLLRDIVGIEATPDAKPAINPSDLGLDIEKKNDKELDDLLIEMLKKSTSMLACVDEDVEETAESI